MYVCVYVKLAVMFVYNCLVFFIGWLFDTWRAMS